MKILTKKYIIFIGIFLLIAGIILRSTGFLPLPGLVLIITGGTLKLIYIIAKMINKEYKPGAELLLLFVGLGLFFLGRHFIPDWTNVMMTLGILFKVSFVFLFIRKTRRT
jgi:energy-coupling factor transporter transmembrane protein EcfT